MNSKNYFLRLLGMAFRKAFILLLVLSFFTATPTRAAGGPDLVVTKSHAGGNFIPLENSRTYTITVTNQGDDPTDGSLVTVVDALPPVDEMTVTAISGTGWTCTLGTLTCTRTDVLSGGSNASYPNITVTVNVLVGAQNPQDNQATVSGGGELAGSTSNNTSAYDIPVDAKPDLVILSYEIRDLATNNIITNPNANEAFYIRVRVKNQGGAGTAGVFYTGAFLDNKPNYGGDVPLGTITPWSDFQISTGVGGNNKGCVFYDPPPLLNQSITDIDSLKNWGNYTRQNLNNALDPGTTEDVDIKIEYLVADYSDPLYDTLNIRSGLKAGNYNIYLYADPMCIGDEEVNENNNSYQISLSVASVGGFPSGPTNVDVTIGGTSRGIYAMDPSESMVAKYALDGGPVVISSDNGVGIIASLNQWRRRPSTPVGWTGVAQSMGLPVSLITNAYYFPRYDDSAPSSLYNALLLANVDTVSRDITVTIGGIVRGTYTLAPSASQFVSYPGVVGGPVVVSSVPGAQIVASLYELIRDPSAPGWNGQSEMMGLPATSLSDSYLIPIYFGAANPNTLNVSLYIANVDTIATTVEIRIAGVLRGTYPLAPNTGQVVKYALDGGPVEISSTNGANIVASLNQWRRRPSTTVGWTGVAQSMALPVALITNQYFLPRYDDSAPNSLYNALLLANVDTVSRDITVTIGGVIRGTYTIAPSQSQFVSYPGVVGGPVVISSEDGARIVASLYELIRDPSAAGWNGQSEMMGLPASQISDQYLIPLYFGAANPNTLNASIHIAVP